MLFNRAMTKELPKKYNHNEVEEKWVLRWEELQGYAWDSSAAREDTFIVDTPPPTVSGSLHVGHVFSYTQTDIITRFQRMIGKNIFYPMGWDDNGLPTERRVQNYFGVRCVPTVPYDPEYKPREKFNPKKDKPEEISRKNFIELCNILTVEDEKAFESTFRRLGLSVDWKLQYETINEQCREVSQRSFLDLIEKGDAYQAEAPTMWDVDFQSAIAQAELVDKEIPGAFHDIRFGVEGGGEFVISTTRPELLASCVAVVAHPDDERYKPLFGKTAITPLFHAEVPIMPADHADPEKGSGILMVCTFGDIMDVTWWKPSGLPLKQTIGAKGTLLPVTFGEDAFQSKDPESAQKNYDEISGLYIKKAQKRIVELLSEDGTSVDGKNTALVGEPKPITHPVKFYEKGDRPLEFVPTRQWFVKILDHKKDLLKQGEKIKWHPEYMHSRYEHWVEGLNQDWCVSRQRYFGVPFPIWYQVGEDGSPNYEKPIYAKLESLPVDPQAEVPSGYEESQRDKPGGFTGDPDVMDTWATSSLTPQIESHWGKDEARHQQLFPMDIRPQGHDIIRTWAFYTIVKAWLHHKEVPWHNIVLSGWILDPDRKKMSKSVGNVVTPEGLFQEYSSDAIRYWAARARLGVDTAFDEGLFKIGRKLTTKLFNASKFVLMQCERGGVDVANYNLADITEPLDLAFVERMRGVIENSTEAFHRFDYATALQSSEDTFWNFCDHYLELVKARSYTEEDSAGRRSAFATLSWSLETFLRLFAPFTSFVADEVWSWAYESKSKSVHNAPWPTVEEVAAVAKPQHAESLDAAIEVISKIRGAKTDAQKSLKWPVEAIKLSGSDQSTTALKSVLEDVLSAGNVTSEALDLISGKAPEQGMFEVAVTLAENSA